MVIKIVLNHLWDSPKYSCGLGLWFARHVNQTLWMNSSNLL